jgi:hypothetical protein
MNGMVMNKTKHTVYYILTVHEVLSYVMYEYLCTYNLLPHPTFHKPMNISSLMSGLWNQHYYECEGLTV